MVCNWPFMASLDSGVAPPVKPAETGRLMGKTVRVKITQAEYESGLSDCRSNLHGRLILHKGDTPLTTLALKTKLSNLWPNIMNWDLTPLGKGFFELHFNSVEDMRRIWAMGAVNLKPGLMSFYCLKCDFTPQAQVQTHAQIWVRFMHLPREYWRKKTLFEIASGLGTPLIIDDATMNMSFGLYAHVLIDVDLSDQMFESVIVERDGHALSVMVEYKKQPSFCSQCKMLGHDILSCLKLISQNQTEGTSKVTKKAQPATQYNRNQPKNVWSSKRTILTHEDSTTQAKHMGNVKQTAPHQGVSPIHKATDFV